MAASKAMLDQKVSADRKVCADELVDLVKLVDVAELERQVHKVQVVCLAIVVPLDHADSPVETEAKD